MESKGVKNFTRARKIKNVHERARELYTCTSKLAFFTICSVIDCIYGWEESRRKKNRISESLRGVMNSILFDYSNSIDFYWIDQFLMLRIEWIARTWGEEKKVHYKFILMNFSISLNCNGAVEGMRERESCNKNDEVLWNLIREANEGSSNCYQKCLSDFFLLKFYTGSRWSFFGSNNNYLELTSKYLFPIKNLRSKE
jgi:hypothetical protein